MKIEKLPSGSYRFQKQINGKRISRTFDHKPSEKEILLAITEEINNQEVTQVKQMNFKTACTKYIDSKENVLSPSTIRSYTQYLDLIPEWFMVLPINDVEQIHINRLVNELTLDKSPKTVRNYHGFISSVLGTYRPLLKLSTTLPQKRKNEDYMPSQDDVRKVMEHFKTNYPDMYVGLYLCACGLRRGEMVALTPDDVYDDIVHIRRAKAINKDKEWITKSTKTTKSTRDIPIPHEIEKLIKEQGFVYKNHPNNLLVRLHHTQDVLGIPHFTVHSLRHYFCAMLTYKGIDEQTILDLGGWETDDVMKKAYRYSLTMKDDKSKRKAMKKVTDSLF